MLQAEMISSLLNEHDLIVWYIRSGHDRVCWTHGKTCTATNAFVWVDEELIVTLVDAIHWADVHAGSVLDANTRLGDHGKSSHGSSLRCANGFVLDPSQTQAPSPRAPTHAVSFPVPSEPFFPSGHIEVVCGPMFSGKSEELIRRVTRALIAKQRVFVFKPKLDDRYHITKVASHAGRTAEARAVESTLEVRAFLGLAPEPALFGFEAPLAPERALPDLVAFDEAQFFDEGLVPLALELVRAGVRVICGGLDLDFRGEPFGVMPDLLARAEHVEKLTAVCPVCGAPATRTQRLVNGMPARFDDPVIMVGAAEAYEPRCRAHHDVPRSSPKVAAKAH